MAIETGGPAFPVSVLPGSQTGPSDGMTLRDWFAGQALKSLILKVPLHDRTGEHGIHTPEVDAIHAVRLHVSESAWDYASAMLDTRGDE